MKNELDKVLDERDLLAARLQNDMDQMNEKITQMKEEYELVVKTLNNELTQIRETNEQKQLEIDRAGEQLAEKARIYDELRLKYEDLDKQFADLRSQLDFDFERKMRERENDFAEKMTLMDEKLNEARREQAKAVVLMRQMERSTNREKEKLEALLKSCDSYYKEHVNKLQEKMQALEKEKNMLASSLRQQGNMGYMINI